MNRTPLYVFWVLIIAAYLAVMYRIQQHPARNFAVEIDELRTQIDKQKFICSQKTGIGP